MKVAIVSNKDFIEQLLISKMRAEGVPDIGCNPSLAGIINQSWNWPAIKLFYFVNDELVAFLSVVLIKKKWVSLPHFDHGSLWVSQKLKTAGNFGGFVADEKDIHNFLYLKCAEMVVGAEAAWQGVENYRMDLTHQELQNIEKLQNAAWKVDLACRSHLALLKYHQDSKVVPVLHLAENWQQQFRALKTNVRRKINKSIKNSFTIQMGGSDLLEDFYLIYRRNIQRLGSFGLPKVFFKNLIENYKYGSAAIFVAYQKGQPAGASILLTMQNAAENGWFSSSKSFNRCYVTYYLHAAMIKYAIDAGCATYSFGRSTKNSTGHHYKQQWGAKDVPLCFNSTQEIHDLSSIFNFTRYLIRRLPKGITAPLDGIVSRHIY